MEDPVGLEENLEALISEMEALDSVMVHVEEKGERRMEKWIQNATDKGYDIDELRNQIEEVKRNGFSDNNLSVRQELNSEVIKSLNEVKTLIQGANLTSTSIDSLRLQLAYENPKRYTYDELKEYSSNFKEKIGAGAFGDVYLGKFPNGLEIAVKVLKVNDVEESMFETEVLKIGMTYHRHLVKLFGFCYDASNKALVYEYLKKGSLDNLLYKNGNEVEWSTLYKIAVEMGQALAYLHHGCPYEIIHHDVKAANVLLDADYSPRVTDFGLANLMSRDEAYQTLISGQGTRGYTAPEVSSSFSHVTFKCDVYNFGMVLFEVLGRRINSEGKNSFPKEVWNALENNELDDLIVGCGIKEKDRENAKILTLVAFWCVQHTPETRPTMSTVETVLVNEIVVNMPPNPFLVSDYNKFQMRLEPEISFSSNSWKFM